MALVLVFGMVRLAFFAPQPGTVRVAGIVDQTINAREVVDIAGEDREEFRKVSAALHDSFFDATVREARAGAKIVVWPEGGGIGDGEDEAALIERAQETARQEGIYLVMGMFTIFATEDRPSENKLLIVDPNGEVALEHVKYGGSFLEGTPLHSGTVATVDHSPRLIRAFTLSVPQSVSVTIDRKCKS